MKSNNITIGKTLSELFFLSNQLFRNQPLFFASIFHSYHDYRSQQENYAYLTDQAQISRLLSDAIRFPKNTYVFYFRSTANQSVLRNDIHDYLQQVIFTANQEDLYLSTFIARVKESQNLHPRDKQYILDYASETGGFDALVELVFRVLRITILQSVQHLPLNSKRQTSSAVRVLPVNRR